MKPTRRKSVNLVTETGLLINVQSAHKLWSTLKSAVLGMSSSLPPLVNEGGGLVCESASKADLLSDHFDSKQSREAVDLPHTCHPSPSLTTLAYRSREVRRLLLDLDPYGGTDLLGMFPLFLKRTADVLGPRLSGVFRRLVRLGSFPPCSSQANVTTILKVHSPPLLQIMTDFHNMFCLRCLGALFLFVLDDSWNVMVCFQPPCLLIGKVWVPVMHFSA